jgi:hypothetical protein
MAAGVDPAEVAKFRGMLRNGGTMPSMEPRQSIVDVPAKPRRNARASGRFRTLNDFCDHSARCVDTTAQAAWLMLYRETKSNGVACMSHGQIAQMIGTSRRTVIRAVQHLEDAKLITVIRRGGLAGGSSSYRVHGTPEGVTLASHPTSATSVTGGVANRVNSA